MTTRQLLLWPKGANLAPLKAVVEGMGLPFKVAPHWFEPGVHSGRVLALDSGFPFLHDHICPKSDSVFSMSVEWALNMRELDRGPHSVESILEKAFGAPVREVFDEASSESD